MTFSFVFQTPDGEICPINKFNIFSIAKSKDSQQYKFNPQDCPIIQHPFLLKWAEKNIKTKFSNFRTISVELEPKNVDQYFDVDLNRFKFRKCFLKKTDPPRTTHRTKRLHHANSSEKSMDSSFDTPPKKPNFDLNTFMAEKKALIYDSKSLDISEWLEIYDYGCNCAKMDELDRFTAIPRYLSGSECLDYYKFCIETGRDWEKYKSFLLRKHSKTHLKRVEKTLLKKFDLQNKDFKNDLEKAAKDLSIVLPSLNTRDLLKILSISLPDELIVDLKEANPKDIKTFIAVAGDLFDLATVNPILPDETEQQNQVRESTSGDASSSSANANAVWNPLFFLCFWFVF